MNKITFYTVAVFSIDLLPPFCFRKIEDPCCTVYLKEVISSVASLLANKNVYA